MRAYLGNCVCVLSGQKQREETFANKSYRTTSSIVCWMYLLYRRRTGSILVVILLSLYIIIVSGKRKSSKSNTHDNMLTAVGCNLSRREI